MRVAGHQLHQLGIDRLRFFLRGAGQPDPGVATSCSARTPSRWPTPTAPRSAAGRRAGHARSNPPASRRRRRFCHGRRAGFSGFRLLTEYFAFPEKFLFLDFTRIDTKTLVSAGNRLEIFVYLDRALPELERTDRPAVAGARLRAAGQPVSAALRAGARSATWTPNTAWCPMPAARARRRSGASNGCAKHRPDGSFRPWRPFYRLTDSDPDPGVPGGFYHVARRPAASGRAGNRSGPGAARSRHSIRPSPLKPCCRSMRICVNRDLPTDLPFGGGHPTLAPGRGRRGGRGTELRSPRLPRRCGRRCAKPASGAWSRICRSATFRSPAAPRAPGR